MTPSSTGLETPLLGDILIVDDTPANLRLLSDLLIEQGYKVRSALNGKLALMGAQAAPPDLILLDIKMPGLSGYEVCEQLKADPRTHDIPIIFISALDQTEGIVKAFTLGGVDYITKPFQPEEVLARVETQLALHRLQRQLAAANTELQEANAELEEEKTRVEAARTMLWTVLNSLDALVYVVDMDTYEVLFTNAQLEQVFGQVEGGICWQALQEGQTGPCSFCSIPALLGEQGQPSGIYRWQFQNTRDGRWYTVADSAIEWIDGRLVRLSMAADITDYKQAETQLVAQQRLMAALDERERIGRELHDDLTQTISQITMQAQTLQALLEGERLPEAQATLRQLMNVASDAQGDVRQYVLGIRQPASPAAELVAPDFLTALDHYLRELHQRYGLQVRVSWPDDLPDSPLTLDVETQLLRIIREALTNVRKHAGVDVARIIFALHTDEFQIIIQDEGKGFDTTSPGESVPESTYHFGLDIIRERAESVGGRLELRSRTAPSPDAGTQVIVHLPRRLVSTVGKDIRGVRMLLADDHLPYLEGMRSMLHSRGIQIVGTARDGLTAVESARNLRPDLILMDVNMPGCDGVEATRRIKADLPSVKIVMMTVEQDEEVLFAALKAGASGYLIKGLDIKPLLDMLTSVLGGERVLSPALAARVLTGFAQREAITSDALSEDLTSRQLEVAALIAQGTTNQEIAERLCVSENTVKYHVRQILERLNLSDRHQIARYARQRGLGGSSSE